MLVSLCLAAEAERAPIISIVSLGPTVSPLAMGSGLVANAVLGEPGVEYDLDKLIYLGSPNSVTQYIFLSKKEVGLDDLEKLRSRTGIRVGGQTVGHDIYINGRLFAWILGLKEPRFVPGYWAPSLTWL